MFQLQVPVHKIMFLDPSPQAPVGLHNPQGGRGHVIDEVPFVKQLITSLSVTDRPDLMVLVRKGSDTGSASRYGKTANTDDGDSASEGSGGRNSVSSMDAVMRGGKFFFDLSILRQFRKTILFLLTLLPSSLHFLVTSFLVVSSL